MWEPPKFLNEIILKGFNDQNLVGIKKQRNLVAKFLSLILVNSQTYIKR